MHQCKGVEKGPHNYIVEVTPGLVKVGRSDDVSTRMYHYQKHLHCWVSRLHADAADTEQLLKQWCSENGQPAGGYEFFEIDFESVVDYADTVYRQSAANSLMLITRQLQAIADALIEDQIFALNSIAGLRKALKNERRQHRAAKARVDMQARQLRRLGCDEKSLAAAHPHTARMR